MGRTYEVDTDGRDVAFGVGIVRETEEQARLSDTGISDEEKLEQIVIPFSKVKIASMHVPEELEIIVHARNILLCWSGA